MSDVAQSECGSHTRQRRPSFLGQRDEFGAAVDAGVDGGAAHLLKGAGDPAIAAAYVQHPHPVLHMGENLQETGLGDAAGIGKGAGELPVEGVVQV